MPMMVAMPSLQRPMNIDDRIGSIVEQARVVDARVPIAASAAAQHDDERGDDGWGKQ